jgi:hypothetical protein
VDEKTLPRPGFEMAGAVAMAYAVARSRRVRAMRRRKLRWMLAGLIAAGVFVLWPRSITPGLTQENFDRVEAGMTLPEVKALLGEPYMQDTNGIQPPGPRHPDWGVWCWRDEAEHTVIEGFDYVGEQVRIGFHDAGKVTYKQSKIFVVTEDAPPRNPLRWFRYQWRKWFPE